MANSKRSGGRAATSFESSLEKWLQGPSARKAVVHGARLAVGRALGKKQYSHDGPIPNELGRTASPTEAVFALVRIYREGILAQSFVEIMTTVAKDSSVDHHDSAWLYVVVRNTAATFLQKTSREWSAKLVLPNDDLELLALGSPSVDGAADARIKLEKIRAMLSTDDLELLIRADSRGDRGELAAENGMTKDALSKRIERTRERARRVASGRNH